MRIYFKNLDGIRFIAAFLVILQHTAEYKEDAKAALPNSLLHQFKEFGGYGVTLFFVLSGFLIFYLLFAEHDFKKTIDIKSFYIRRILRIWPLYMGFGLVLIFGIDYAMKILGTPVSTPVFVNLFYLLTFSINLQLLFSGINRGIIELYWSVCIEEQFYLVAPWLVKKWFPKMLYVIIALIGVGITSKFFMRWLEIGRGYHFNNNNPLYFFTLCRIDNFGIGALAAYIYFRKDLYRKVERFVTNKWIQATVTLFTILYMIKLVPMPWFERTYFFSTTPSVLYAYLILAASTGHFFVNLEKPLLKSLGKYSYGIYVYHAVLSQLILVAFLKILPAKTVLNYDIIYPLACTVITALVAALSYEIYEKPFMKLKQRFTIVKNHET
ncbi:MAG: acyltransferase [Ferruginibacter sp.]